MKTAKKMFEDYIIPVEIMEGEFTLGYYFPSFEREEIHIIFNKQFPRVHIVGSINTYLLQAINQQIKELGWGDVE